MTIDQPRSRSIRNSQGQLYCDFDSLYTCTCTNTSTASYQGNAAWAPFLPVPPLRINLAQILLVQCFIGVDVATKMLCIRSFFFFQRDRPCSTSEIGAPSPWNVALLGTGTKLQTGDGINHSSPLSWNMCSLHCFFQCCTWNGSLWLFGRVV